MFQESPTNNISLIPCLNPKLEISRLETPADNNNSNIDNHIPLFSTYRSYTGTASDALKRLNLDSIWPEHVENAFQVALSIIPKKGLKKNKVCRIALGRNQYISMYIKEMTGEMRTAKQISSHIQTIYRSNKDHALIHLIKYGAPNDAESLKTFRETFSIILGSNDMKLNSKPVEKRKHVIPSKKGVPLLANKRPERCSIFFSEPNKLVTLLPGIIISSKQLERFPNVLVNIHSIRLLLAKKLDVGSRVQDLPNIPVPLIYRHSGVYLPNISNYRQTEDVKCGGGIEYIFNNLKGLRLGLLTMVYCKDEKISEEFELIDGKQYVMDFGKRFWEARLSTKIQEFNDTKNLPNWAEEVASVSLEQYVVSVSGTGGTDICIDEIQSIIISEFDYSSAADSCVTQLKACVGYDFDIDVMYPILEVKQEQVQKDRIDVVQELEQELQSKEYIEPINDVLETAPGVHVEKIQKGTRFAVGNTYANSYGEGGGNFNPGTTAGYQTYSESDGYSYTDDRISYSGSSGYNDTNPFGMPALPPVVPPGVHPNFYSGYYYQPVTMPVSEMYKPMEMMSYYHPTMVVYEEENNQY